MENKSWSSHTMVYVIMKINNLHATGMNATNIILNKRSHTHTQRLSLYIYIYVHEFHLYKAQNNGQNYSKVTAYLLEG